MISLFLGIYGGGFFCSVCLVVAGRPYGNDQSFGLSYIKYGKLSVKTTVVHTARTFQRVQVASS